MHDRREHDGADVRSWLAGVEPASPWPSPFDAAEAVRRGQSRRRRHRVAGAGAVAAAILVVAAVPALAGRSSGPDRPPSAASSSGAPSAKASATAQKPTECEIVGLPLPGGLAGRGVSQPSRVFVTAMDPTGNYVVAGAFAAANDLAAVILWHNRVPMVLPTAGAGMVMNAVAVNSHGVVAGTGEVAGQGYAWVYRNGVVMKLPSADGYGRLVQVQAVNESGDVLGTALSESGDRSAVVVWPAAEPDQPQIQPALTGKLEGFLAGAFTDGGGVQAWSTTAGSPASTSLRTLWSGDGRRRVLPLPDGFATGAISGVRGSWAFGEARKQTPSVSVSAGNKTGRVRTSGSAPTSVRWDLRTGTVEVVAGTLPTYNMDLGVMPGFAATDGAAGGKSAIGYSALGGNVNGQTFILPVPDGAASPVAVNSDGSVVAGSVGPADDHGYAGKTRPALWRC